MWLTKKLQELAKETGTRTVQLLAVHVAGVRNVGADRLSRGEGGRREFFAALKADSRLLLIEVEFPPEAFALTLGLSHAHGDGGAAPAHRSGQGRSDRGWVNGVGVGGGAHLLEISHRGLAGCVHTMQLAPRSA